MLLQVEMPVFNLNRNSPDIVGVRHARAVSNGTAALFMSMVALGVGPGDRVLTTPLTWIATAAAPATLGAEIDFVDIDPITYNIDPEQLENKLTDNTKAVIPVHLYGQCCDMDPIYRWDKNMDSKWSKMPAMPLAQSIKTKKQAQWVLPDVLAFTNKKTSQL